jgi:4-hydroxy-tetrahydrodipicolinate reductase
MKTRVILAGATGWAGAALARGIAATHDLELVAAVARKAAGSSLGAVLDEPRLAGCTVYASGAVALAAAIPPRVTDPGAAATAASPRVTDPGGAAATAASPVFVEYTLPETARAHALAALEAGAHVVIGTSGLADDDFAAIDARARAAGRAVLACGNFALTVVLLQKFAEMAARWVPHFEVIDFGKLAKPDAPSGTARELAARLGAVRAPDIGVPLDEVRGPREARGASVAGVQVHSMRLPGFVSGVEVVFGLEDQRLHLRHQASGGAGPYVDGALLAIRRVHTLEPGVHRGLDRVMDL